MRISRSVSRGLTPLVGALAFSLTLPSQAADAYPSRPIRMVIGFPAGGPTDVNARLFAVGMAEEMGQPIIVENKPGTGSNLASSMVLNALPDGYTVLYNTSSLILGAMLYTSAKFDPLKDFLPVARTAGVPLVVAVGPSAKVADLDGLAALAKSQPGKLNYASSGAGTIDHLAAALLTTKLGVSMEHIPYKGTAPALVDLVAGNTEMFFTTQNTLLPFIKEKRLTPLAIASLERSPLMPNVPTVGEAAHLPGFEITAWNGIVVAAGTPAEIVQRLNAAVNTVLKNKDFVARLRATGAEPYGGTAEAYGAYLKSETARWRLVVQQAGVKPE